jgi:predicted Fe-Mo cluster-binding NifX family protein
VNKIKKLKIGIPSKAYAGLKDFVSEVFGKAKTFTIINFEDGKLKNVKVIKNPAAIYKYGSGPIAVKTLVDLRVNTVMCSELGIGAKGLLDQHNIRHILVKPNIQINEIINKDLLTLEKAP